MSSGQKNRISQEKLLFSFHMNVATKKDFEMFLELNSQVKFSDSNYIYKIKEYFITNYVSKIRNYALSIFPANSIQMKQLDNMFLKKWTREDLIKIFQDKNFPQEYDNLTLVSINYNLEDLLKADRKEGKIPFNVLLELYILSLLLTKETNSTKAVTIFLKHKLISKNLQVFQEIIHICKLKYVEPSIIKTIIIENIQNISPTYLKTIDVLDFMSVPFKENEIQDKLNQFIQKYNFHDIPDLLIKMLLDYFDQFKFSNKFLYFNIFKILSGEINQQTYKSHESILCKWIINKIEDIDLDISLYITELINVFKCIHRVFTFDFEEIKLAEISISKIVLMLAEKESSKDPLVSYNNNISKYIKYFLTFKESPFLIKFSSYYFLLLSKFNEMNMTIKTLQRIQINSQQFLNFDICCIFIYLNPKLRLKIRQKDIFKDMFHDLELNNKKQINPFDYIRDIENLSSFKTYFLNDYCYLDNCEVIKIIELNSIGKIDDLNKLIKKIITKNNPYIICFQIKDKLDSLVKNFDINHIPIDFDNIYTFQGLFFINNNKQKNIILYENMSQQYYSMVNNKWVSDLNINNIISDSLTLVYFRKKNLTRNIDFNSNVEKIENINVNKEQELKLQLFLKMLNINTNLITRNINFYFNFLSLNNLHNLSNLYTPLKHHNNTLLSQQLLSEFLNLRNTNDNELSLLKIEKYCFYMKPEILLQHFSDNFKKLSKSDISTVKQFKWNAQYYLNNINKIKHIPIQLVFYLVFSYFITILSKEEVEQFIINIFQNISILPKILLTPNNFFKGVFSSLVINNYFNNISQYLNKYHPFMNLDYQYKFLIELVLFSNTNKTNVVKTLISLLQRNIDIISIKDTNDNNVISILRALYKMIIHLYKPKENNVLYIELIRICFELNDDFIYNRNPMQLTMLQMIVFGDYLSYYVNREELLLSNKDTNYILKIIKFISKFIFESQTNRCLFAKTLLILKRRNDLLYLKLKDILIKMFYYPKENNLIAIKNIIVYYLASSTILHKQKEIEKTKKFKSLIMKPQQNMDIYYIFAFLNPKIQKLFSKHKNEKTQDKYNIYNLYTSFNSNKNDSHFISIYKNIMKQLLNENHLELIDMYLKRKCFAVIKENKKLYPNNESNDIPFIPYIIYDIVDGKSNYLKELSIKYYGMEYILHGLIFESLDTKEVYIRNEKNSYWYLVNKNEWLFILDNLKGPYVNIIKVFYLKKENKESIDLTFKDLEEQKQVEKIFDNESYEINWITKNAIFDHSIYGIIFHQMFE